MGTNTDVAKETGEAAKEVLESDHTNNVKTATPRNVAEDNLPTVGGPYGAGELDAATNRGALGLGAAKVVSEKAKGELTDAAVEITKKMVPKAIWTG